MTIMLGTNPIGVLPTDHRFTGQKQDGSGLIYMNARYYDPVIGQFISPDTLVPDATNLLDYNRYGYARGNPMKFNDPSGHYSNDEIMQHYGCSDWGCVKAQSGDGGSHAGLWGWLLASVRHMQIYMNARYYDPVLGQFISPDTMMQAYPAFDQQQRRAPLPSVRACSIPAPPAPRPAARL